MLPWPLRDALGKDARHKRSAPQSLQFLQFFIRLECVLKQHVTAVLLRSVWLPETPTYMLLPQNECQLRNTALETSVDLAFFVWSARKRIFARQRV